MKIYHHVFVLTTGNFLKEREKKSGNTYDFLNLCCTLLYKQNTASASSTHSLPFSSIIAPEYSPLKNTALYKTVIQVTVQELKSKNLYPPRKKIMKLILGGRYYGEWARSSAEEQPESGHPLLN